MVVLALQYKYDVDVDGRCLVFRFFVLLPGRRDAKLLFVDPMRSDWLI